ncbi:MAG: thiamine diphosphokinase [Chloroflexota bacterium]|nr:thiamine diphosphokinase [Chloroflexota bacterium]
MLAFVVSGGELKEPRRFEPFARAADLTLAADSGYDHMLLMGVRPDVLMGDLDSISSAALEDARQGRIAISTFPQEKDYTDTELVLREALDRGADTILSCGAFGMRLDHLLANVLLLASPVFRGVDLRLLDEEQEVRLVRGRLELVTVPGETISLIPVGGQAMGVTTSGLYYPLSAATLETGPALGISNVATGPRASVEVADGLVLLTRIFAGGLDAARYLVDNPPTQAQV